MQPSRNVARIPLSKTIALDTRAKQLIASGQDVINMAVGEPDFPAPVAAREAACNRVQGGDVRYTPAPGLLSLRQAVAEHLTQTRGVTFTPQEVAICHSAKHALSGSLFALIEPGDEVLLLLPAWVSYVQQVIFAGGVPVEVRPHADCSPDIDALRSALTPRTKGIMLNSPSNPTGYVYSHAEVRAIAELALEHGLWMLSDEIYRRLIYEGDPNLSPASVSPAARERTVIVDGASKSFAMTGYRIGFMAGPEPIATAVGRLHSQLTGSPNTVSQVAYEAVLRSEPPEVAAMASEFQARRQVILDGLRRLELSVPEPRGAFYAFPEVSRFLDERGSAGFCEDLLEDQRLALVPGSAFGVDQHVRMSYALSSERIREALQRFENFLVARGQRT